MSIAEKFEVIADEVYEVGHNKGFDAGKQAMNDAWWKVKTANFTRKGYDYGFAGEDFTYVGGFNPPIQIKPQGYSSRIFSSAKGLGEITADKLDLSLCTTTEFIFAGADTPRIEIINTIGCSAVKSLFSENSYTHTVDKVILKDDGSQTFNQTAFGYTYALENITFEGVIGSDIWFTRSPKLTRDSMLGKLATAEQIADGKNLFTVNGSTYYGGIFGALKTFTAGSNTCTIQLHTTPKALLSDAEKQAVANKGWTIT